MVVANIYNLLTSLTRRALYEDIRNYLKNLKYFFLSTNSKFVDYPTSVNTSLLNITHLNFLQVNTPLPLTKIIIKLKISQLNTVLKLNKKNWQRIQVCNKSNRYSKHIFKKNYLLNSLRTLKIVLVCFK